MIGDFNASEFDTLVENFCDICSLKNLIKEPICFRNPHNPKCIDLITTNRSRRFQNSCVIETGDSDFHKMTATVLRSHLPILGPQTIKYKDYKNFSNEKFWLQINKECEEFQNTLEVDSFLNICNTELNETAPLNQKYVRVNNNSFINKTILKAIMERT